MDRARVPRITLYGCQFKSIEKIRLAATHLAALEEELGIHECEIKLSNCFICPWISERDIETLRTTGMGTVLRDVILQLWKK